MPALLAATVFSAGSICAQMPGGPEAAEAAKPSVATFDDYVNRVYVKYDADKSGGLSMPEAKEAIQAMAKLLTGNELTEDQMNGQGGFVDSNNDNKVSKHELGKHLKCYYDVFAQTAQPEQLDKLLQLGGVEMTFDVYSARVFKKYDADNSGALSMDEVNKAVAELSQLLTGEAPQPEALKNTVSFMDKDGDGQVDAKELRTFLKYYYDCLNMDHNTELLDKLLKLDD